MDRPEITKEYRLALANRVYQWLFDQTECWSKLNHWTTVGLNYLIWAIVDTDKFGAFDVSDPYVARQYADLLEILGKNPNDLLKELEYQGFIHLPENY